MAPSDTRETASRRPAIDAARRASVRRWLSYALAVLGPIALGLEYANEPQTWAAPASLLCQMLIFSVTAVLGGLRPTLLATIVSVVAAVVVYLVSSGEGAATDHAAPSLLVLLAVLGVVTGWLGERSHRDRRALATAAEERERELHGPAAEQAATLESLLAYAPVGLAFFDREGRYLRVNRWLADVAGQPVESFLGRSIAEVSPTVADAIGRIVRDVFTTGAPHEDFTFVTGNEGPPAGHRHWLTCFYPVRRADGSVVSVAMLLLEITAQKQIEDALRDSEERFRALFHANIMPLVRWHIDGRITDANDAFVHMVGYSVDELRRGALRWTSFVMPERSEHLADLVVQFQKTGRFGPEERNYELRDGRRLPVLVGGAALPGHPNEGVAFIFDLSAQKRSEAALAEQLTFSKTLTDNAAAAFFLLDDGGRCTFMNPAAEAMTGYRFDEIRERTFHSAIHHHHPDGSPFPDTECAIRSALMRGESTLHFRDCLIRKNGEFFSALASCSPIFRDGKVVAGVVEIRDVTEQDRIEREREALLDSERAARAEAERANRQKDEFLAMISHELRTPLNAVLGWARLLQRPSRTVEQTDKGLAIIERNAQLEAQIISDLLDISRIVSGKIHLTPEIVRVDEVVESALDVVRPAAEAKGVALAVCLAGADVRVEADPGRLQQMVWNLVSNAVKFTPTGGRVEVSMLVGGGRVEVSVSDTGQGIDPEFLPHVFERFRQADASVARRHGGLGLGLTITRHLVERHGGHVRAESAGVGKGARFTLDLPLAGEAGAGAPSASDTPRALSLKGAKLLAVDDEPDSLELTARVLEEHGATVIMASSAQEALDRLRDDKPDLVVTDIGMPGMDGYELIRHVRTALPAPIRDLPAIALTAFARQEDRERAIRAGFQAHLAKPIEPSRLLAAVAALVDTSAAA
ncbi:two-component sensor histidine kinase [Minicystis rosea]|nr:two-component sensor histidine kinase [Minicystis rosea]